MVDEEGGCRDLALFTWRHLGTPCVQDQGRVGRLEGEVSVNNVARLEHAYSASLFVGRCKCVTGGYYSMVSCLVRQSIGHSCNRLISVDRGKPFYGIGSETHMRVVARHSALP